MLGVAARRCSDSPRCPRSPGRRDLVVERIDQIAVGSDVLQPVERRGPAFEEALRREVLIAHRHVRSEGRHEVTVGGDILQPVHRSQIHARVRIAPLGPARIPVMRERVDAGSGHIGILVEIGQGVEVAAIGDGEAQIGEAQLLDVREDISAVGTADGNLTSVLGEVVARQRAAEAPQCRIRRRRRACRCRLARYRTLSPP